MLALTPPQIVAELNKHIVGQDAAKRAVAVAIRNRWRRQQLPAEQRREITPKNIIMIGPTGVGKTEIARRLASLTGAPFCKVEATKFTEVGYHGRDVESIVRDLAEASFRMVRDQERERVRTTAEERARERLLDMLLPGNEPERDDLGFRSGEAGKTPRARLRLGEMLDAGEFEDRRVRIRQQKSAMPIQVLSNMGFEQMDVDLQRMLEGLAPKAAKEIELPVREARRILIDQEIEQLLDRDAMGERALRLAEDAGIVFIDEIDKVCGSQGHHGPDVSRQGVQRDLLPIVEGTTVQTRYGTLHTDHVLFIAAGAFHMSKPADMMPELQGRFPIRVELKDLGRADFVRILREPESSLIRQYVELMRAEGVTLEFTPDALDTIADRAWHVNQKTQNIGARRLHTVLETLLEELSFDASERAGQTVVIDAATVERRLDPVIADDEVSKYIL